MSTPQCLARCVAASSLRSCLVAGPIRGPLCATRRYSSTKDTEPSEKKPSAAAKAAEEVKGVQKTQAELDRELRLKMQGMAGDGGDAGVEYEDGQPVSMKRSVRNNMFRYI